MMILSFLFVIFLFGRLNGISFSIDTNLERFRCHEDFCDFVTCEKITDCPEGQIVLNSTFCNCCESCIKMIGEGEKCDVPLMGPLQTITTAKCNDGLKCINGTCALEYPLEGCLKIRSIRQKLRGEGIYAEDIWIPECDENGNFQAKQRKKRKGLCMGALGNTLFGQADAGLSENMTCGCSSRLNSLKKEEPEIFMTKPQEHCSPSGNFAHLQCIGDLCYCADTRTGEVDGRIAKMDFLNKLPCYNTETSDTSYLKPCEKELQRTRSLRLSFFLKGLEVIGLEQFQCDPDGTFSPKQCDSTNCVCTDRFGIGIGSYHIGIDNYEKLDNEIICNCARDAVSAVSNSQYPTMRCKGWGNYYLFQCFHNDQCFCVDEDGDAISKELNKTLADESFCELILDDLSGKPRKIPLTSTTSTSTSSETHEETDPDYIYD